MIRLRATSDVESIKPERLSGINELVQARIDGVISRRALIQRGLQLGMTAPLIGVMLHATSDYAFGAPNHQRSFAINRLRQEGDALPITGPTAPAGAQLAGGTVTTGTNEEPDTLHPWLSQSVTGADVLSGIVEPLMKYDSNQVLIPGLAEGFTLAEDGLTYTYTLRQGVTWHNGNPFTAQDVIDSWKMVMNPEFAAFFVLGWDQITDIAAPDERTIVISTGQIFVPFISYMSDSYAAICPSSEMAKGIDSFKQEYGRSPIGTGPFSFVEWRSKDQVVLEANPNYWGGRPILDQIVYRVVPDDNTLLVQLQTGEIQVASGSGAVGPLRVDEALGFDNIDVYEFATLDWSHFDLKHIDFLRMTKVRQALDFATPSQLIVDELLGGRATRAVADQAPGTWAFNPNIEGRPYDPEMAKTLLREAGLTEQDGGWVGPTPAADTADPNGPATGPVKPFEIEIWGLAGESQHQQICQVVAQSWNEIGIKAEAKFEDISTIWGPEGYQFTDKMTAGFYSWTNSIDPDSMFYWHSSQIPSEPTGSGGNTPAYFFPFNFQDKIDVLTQAGVLELNQENRKAIYFEAQQLLHDEVPVIFVFWPNSYPAISKKVGGVWPSASNRLLWNAEKWYLTE